MMVSFLLANRFPLLLWWGPDYISIYNDAYRPILGTKHPKSLGQPVSECWSEIYDVLKPLIDRPFNGGPPTWMEDILLEINRHGFFEETHFTVAYSPVPDDSVPQGIGGVLATVHEITEKVIAERRVALLQRLGAGAIEARTAEQVCADAAASIGKHAEDVPFALLYLIDPDGACARLAGAAGIPPEELERQRSFDLGTGASGAKNGWPFAKVLRTGATVVVDTLAKRFRKAPQGPWADPPRSAVVVPIRSNKQHELAGLLVAGVSSRLRLDGLYSSFFELLAAQVATSIANARAYEEERRRAEALAEIDRLKTTFFSNVSHEFRTPLTLMLGPLEAAIESSALPPSEREHIEVARRNARRLLKLVNALLDFSRIEAGRVAAFYTPTDLPALTAELASVFRSTIERAGLELVVDCRPLSSAAYVDHEMWEKIVLNLVSNAFKFTFAGKIEVALSEVEGTAVLSVRDTGTGIPAEELPHIFDRFHQVKGARGRSYEGSGIGLALVKELVRLHGGSVEVESKLDRGSCFTLTLPLGRAHLPDDRIMADRSFQAIAARSDAFVEETLRWLPDEAAAGSPDDALPAAPTENPAAGARVLLADDNADMRDYVRRLLAGSGYRVEAVADGLAALAAARRSKPDLVLTDVMMPGLDGLGLLRAFRADPQFGPTPVILLSARAGEEARIEGMRASADDYLVKPFSARELLARVQSLLKLTRVRQDAEIAIRRSEGRLRALVEATTYTVYRMNADWTEMLELDGQGFMRDTDGPHRGWLSDYIDPDDQPQVTAAIQKAISTKTIFELEYRARRVDGTLGWTLSRAVPILDDQGQIAEWFGAASDVTERKNAEAALRDLNETLESRVANELAARMKAEEQLRQAQKMEAIGHLTGGVAHDFNNLLQVVLGNLEVAQHRLTDVETQAASDIGRSIHGAMHGAQRAARLTQRLLAFSRRQALAPRSVDVNRLVGGMSELLRRTLGEATAIETVVHGGLWRAFVDPNQLENAILNLAVNARDAMPNGGKLSIEAANADLDERYTREHQEVLPGQYVMLAVGDTGVGMTKAVIESAFEPFFTTKEPGNGTGLGLSQVYGFVKQSSGHIKIDSEPGEGTTVRIYLPRHLEEAQSDEEKRPHEVPVPRGDGSEVILLVEDDVAVRQLSTAMLKELGYAVLDAENASRALDILAKTPKVAVLFTDVGLPGGVNGRQLADLAIQKRPKLKVLFTTGYASDAILQHGRIDRGIRLITKPFGVVALANTIRELLDGQPPQ